MISFLGARKILKEGHKAHERIIIKSLKLLKLIGQENQIN